MFYYSSVHDSTANLFSILKFISEKILMHCRFNLIGVKFKKCTQF